MESEIDLDEAIKELHVLAAAPSLFQDFVKLNAVKSLVGLLQHENNDISFSLLPLSMLHKLFFFFVLFCFGV